MTLLTEILAQDSLYVDPGKLVTFLGLHDQPRFMSEPGATIDGVKLAFTFIFTMRGIPLIYYGDEIGMQGEGDPDNRRDFPGGWKEDPQNAFKGSERTTEQSAVYQHVVKLLRLREEVEALRRGKLVSLAANQATYAFARVISATDYAIVLFNNSAERQHVEVPVSEVVSKDALLTDRLGALGKVKATGGKLSLLLRPRTAAVLAP